MEDLKTKTEKKVVQEDGIQSPAKLPAKPATHLAMPIDLFNEVIGILRKQPYEMIEVTMEKIKQLTVPVSGN